MISKYTMDTSHLLENNIFVIYIKNYKIEAALLLNPQKVYTINNIISTSIDCKKLHIESIQLV